MTRTLLTGSLLALLAFPAITLAQTEAPADDSATAAADQPDATLVEVIQRSATVTVTVPPPTITVIQRPPQIIVRQRDAIVEVTQKDPEVTVRQLDPEVRVEQPEPEVEVRLRDPEIRIEQPNPEVSVAQREPEVRVRQARPRVRVATQEPLVAVSQPEPTVSVSQAEAQVEIKVEQPEINVQQADPKIAVQRVAEVDPSVSQIAPAADATDTAAIRVEVDRLVGADVANRDGETIGTIERIAYSEADQTAYVVLVPAEALAIGGRTLLIPYADFDVGADPVVLDIELTPAAVEGMPAPESRELSDLPEDMVAR